METYLQIFGAIAPVLFFVAYYHPAAYRRIVDPTVTVLCVLACTVLFSTQFAVLRVQRFVSNQDLVGASSAVNQQYREIVRRIGDLEPPFEWFLLPAAIYFVSVLLCFLPQMGITRDSRDSKT